MTKPRNYKSFDEWLEAEVERAFEAERERLHAHSDGQRSAHAAILAFKTECRERLRIEYWRNHPKSAAVRTMREEVVRDRDAFIGLNMRPGA